ncbi:ParA family protein [Streptomyces sp. N35]|uniref:ParA family protein n=1 Tax=Streptomyces sp. N35 TaxID=2795730 RepID=UPI0018F60B63|nr:ParA family protein [Streptomyces sp. N35]
MTQATSIPLPAQRPLIRRLYRQGPLVIVFANEGGGTRKTTDIVNTGVELAQMGVKVGIGDLDQTMAASTYLGYGVTNRKFYPNRTEQVYAQLAAMPSMYGVLTNECTLKEAMVPARTRVMPVTRGEQGEILDDGRWDTDECFEVIPNLHLILGSRDMAIASEDIRNAGRPGSRSKAGLHWLRKAIEDLPQGTLDVLLLDSRGTFDTLELTELGAADYVIGCVKPDTKDDDTLHGLKALIATAQEQFEFSGGAAELRYILFNGYAKNRGKFYLEMFDELQTFYGDMLLPYVSENVQVAESVKAQEPVHFWMQGQDTLVVDQFGAIARVIARDLQLISE